MIVMQFINIPIFKTNVNNLRTHKGILIMLSTFLDICILMDHQKSELLSLLSTIQVVRIHLLVSLFIVHDIVQIALPLMLEHKSKSSLISTTMHKRRKTTTYLKFLFCYNLS
jgi:hypothetical protein